MSPKDEEEYNNSWVIFDMLKLNEQNENENKKIKTNYSKYELHCKCGSIEYNELNVCTSCGIVYNQYEYSYSYNENGNENSENKTSYYGISSKYCNSRLAKLNLWYNWSKDEKNKYKLEKYTKELCDKLNVYLYIDYICNTVHTVLNVIKQQDGTKRSRVKDGIIIMCIYYIYKTINPSFIMEFKPNILAQKIKLHYKYISKAEKIILELLNKNKIKFNETTLSNKNLSCDEYINDGLKDKIKLLYDKVPNKIYLDLSDLIKLCEKKEILIEHTPYTVVIASFYYILVMNNINIQLSDFAHIYSISMMTILKVCDRIHEIKNSL